MRRPRRRRDPVPRTIRGAPAASRRPRPTDYPRSTRGVAATPSHGLSSAVAPTVEVPRPERFEVLGVVGAAQSDVPARAAEEARARRAVGHIDDERRASFGLGPRLRRPRAVVYARVAETLYVVAREGRRACGRRWRGGGLSLAAAPDPTAGVPDVRTTRSNLGPQETRSTVARSTVARSTAARCDRGALDRRASFDRRAVEPRTLVAAPHFRRGCGPPARSTVPGRRCLASSSSAGPNSAGGQSDVPVVVARATAGRSASVRGRRSIRCEMLPGSDARGRSVGAPRADAADARSACRVAVTRRRRLI